VTTLEMKNQHQPPPNMQVNARDTSSAQTVSEGGFALVLQKMEQSERKTIDALTDALNGVKLEMQNNKDEVMHGVSDACTRAARAEEISVKTAAECHELRTTITHQQHIIDEKDAQLRLWQLQSEQDRPFRAEKMNTVYVVPTPSNNTPFSSEELEYSQASITTKPNTRGGVEVKFTSREECGEILKQFPNIKNTQKPYRASYAKTPLQQRRDRLYYAIKQRLPRGVTGYIAKGQLHVTPGSVSMAQKGEAPSNPYPAWLHAKVTPSGMDISGDPINLESVPHNARQATEYAEYEHMQKTGNNNRTTPMRTLTDGGEADISDVEMADRASRGRSSPTGETPGGKRFAAKK